MLWVFVAARRLSLASVSGDYSSLQCSGFSLQWLLLVEHGLYACGFQWLQHMSSRVLTQSLWYRGQVAPQKAESSQTRDGVHVPCIDKWTPIHRTTREVWCVCVCVYVYVYIYINFFVCVYICICMYIYIACICMYICVCYILQLTVKPFSSYPSFSCLYKV